MNGVGNRGMTVDDYVPVKRLEQLPEDQLDSIRKQRIGGLARKKMAELGERARNEALQKLSKKLKYKHLSLLQCKMILNGEGHEKSDWPKGEVEEDFQKYLCEQPLNVDEELEEDLKKLSKQGKLDPDLLKERLAYFGRPVETDCDAYYIIALEVGGINHIDNLCVLPKKLPAPGRDRTHTALLACMLPEERLKTAIKICSKLNKGAYRGHESVKELEKHKQQITAEAALFPWPSTQAQGRRRANGAPANAGAAAAAAGADSQGGNSEEVQGGAAGEDGASQMGQQPPPPPSPPPQQQQGQQEQQEQQEQGHQEQQPAEQGHQEQPRAPPRNLTPQKRAAPLQS